MLIDLSFIFVFSFSLLFIMRKIARKVGLVDAPNHRKNHEGIIPIAGGISICIILAHVLYTRPDLVEHDQLLLACVVVLAIIGTLDDYFDLNALVRLALQIALSLAFIHVSGLKIHFLGDVFGFGEVNLGFLSVAVTVLAILAAINAFNMVDGLDGLLGSLSVVTFASLSYLLNHNGHFGIAYLCLIIVATILPYICMNLGFLGRKRKVFMGDAGSMMIGFVAVWLLINASQVDDVSSINPVTVLWLIAVPLMDMTATVIVRLRQKVSPFRSDNQHIHFILQGAGLSAGMTLVIISSLAIFFAGVGVASELMNVADYIMFYAFLGCFALYYKIRLILQHRYSAV